VSFHHVNTRRNLDQQLFVDDVDRVQFLHKLEQTVFRNRWLCHGYCLMSNHYHLLLETPEHNLGAGMLLLNGAHDPLLQLAPRCGGARLPGAVSRRAGHR
jgi:hypothetical protein